MWVVQPIDAKVYRRLKGCASLGMLLTTLAKHGAIFSNICIDTIKNRN